MVGLWALLLRQCDLVKCISAYMSEPLASALALSCIAENLSREVKFASFSDHCFRFQCHDRFDANALTELSESLRKATLLALEEAFAESPSRVYAELCRPLDAFRKMPLPQLAYQVQGISR